jgi:hypothetical protein
MRRMTYCGTDVNPFLDCLYSEDLPAYWVTRWADYLSQGYMSPEIINGQAFDLPTDVFSLGIIFIEIMSRRLVDSRTYTVRLSTTVLIMLMPRSEKRLASHRTPTRFGGGHPLAVRHV